MACSVWRFSCFLASNTIAHADERIEVGQYARIAQNDARPDTPSILTASYVEGYGGNPLYLT